MKIGNMQRTIAREAEITGFGFFTGEDVRVRFKPARVNTGIVFVRHPNGHGAGNGTNGTNGANGSSNGAAGEADAPVRIPVQIAHVARRLRRTTLREGNASVETTEHCLAALAGLGIDNLIIEIDAGELPGIDGSALGYVQELRNVGIVEQEADRQVFTITRPVSVTEGEAMLAALPGPPDELTITYCLDMRQTFGPDCPIRPQTYSFRLSEDAFVEEIAPARTWLLEQEVEYMRSQGLGLRVTTKDVLVMGREGPIGNTLRFPDELVRHKVLDLVGDLFLLNRRIHGVIYARGSGHSMNHELVRKLTEMIDEDQHAKLRQAAPVLDVRQVQRILPHRYPMLLVDRVLELEDTRAVGIKNVTINEQFFQGHYPGTPVMPGVLLIEAMAQLSGVLLLRKLEHTGKVAYMVAMDKVKLRRPVVPGDQLVLEASAVRIKSRMGSVSCRATVANRLVAEAELTFMLGDAEQT